uniref:Uncharacterized protein n=1 Tax=Anguilla anguilla TaxID=7936 RepID=A0A0E9THA4_ANGAN
MKDSRKQAQLITQNK